MRQLQTVDKPAEWRVLLYKKVSKNDIIESTRTHIQ